MFVIRAKVRGFSHTFTLLCLEVTRLANSNPLTPQILRMPSSKLESHSLAREKAQGVKSLLSVLSLDLHGSLSTTRKEPQALNRSSPGAPLGMMLKRKSQQRKRVTQRGLVSNKFTSAYNTVCLALGNLLEATG